MGCEISVIIPVYNTEKYLRRCLESIVNQTFRDIEIIVINDGSTDNSLEIITEYKKKDCRITLIDQKNKGLSESRNYGIKISTGKFISFVDSDDSLELNAFEEVHKKLIEEKSEILIFRYQRVNNEMQQLAQDIVYDNLSKDDIFRLSISLKIVPISCNKVYKRDLFIDNNLFFPKSMYFEDCALIFKLIYFAKKISFINKFFYNWYDIESSITNSISSKHIEDRAKLLIVLKDFLLGNNIYKMYEDDYFYAILQTLYKLEYSLKFEIDEEIKLELSKIIDEQFKNDNILLEEDKKNFLKNTHPLYYTILDKFLRTCKNNTDFLNKYYNKTVIENVSKIISSKVGFSNLITQSKKQKIKDCYIYGAGEIFDQIFLELLNSNIRILSLIDRDAKKYNYKKNGFNVNTLENIDFNNNANIIVASIDFAQSISEYLEEFSDKNNLNLNIINYYNSVL